MLVSKFLQFTFDTPFGDLVLDVPVCSADWETQKIKELFGFAENTKILVVDDSGTSRKLTQNYLKMAGFFNLVESPDGNVALETLLQAKGEPFGLVVADWHMPEMLGIDLLKAVRTIPATKALPFILATGEQKKNEIVSAIKEGVSAYLVKPIESDSFFQAIQKVGLAMQSKNAAKATWEK